MKVPDMPDVTTVQPQPYGFGELFRLTNFYSRQRYWATGLTVFVINIVAGFILSMIAAAVPPLFVVSFVVSLAFGWILLATAVKRLRDAGVSLWWVLLNFIPVVNLVSVVVFGCIGSSETKNRASAKPIVITAIMLALVFLVVVPVSIILVGWQLINNAGGPRGEGAAYEQSVSGTEVFLPAEVSGTEPVAPVEPVIQDMPADEPVAGAAESVEPAAQ